MSNSPVGSAERPLRVAVIGAGPAGFFAADAFLKNEKKTGFKATVDIFDRLPTPYGLVRYGVAPDHQKLKSVRKVFMKTISNPAVRFFGGVEFGKDMTREDFKAHYDQVIYTVGAQSDRRLNIPGEDLDGSYSATEFVSWYNSHPDYCDRTFSFDHSSVAVIGAGNVALDVARILAKSNADLSTCDIADHALAALADSKIKDIYVFARRGPAQVKFTNKELREFGTLADVAPQITAADFDLDEHSKAALEGNRTGRRNVEIMNAFEDVVAKDTDRRVHFRFFNSPLELIGTDGKVSAIKIVKNELVLSDRGYLNSVATDETETIEVGLVLRSVGYRGVPLPGVPFHESWGTILNEGGRVVDEAGEVVAGEYVSGWARRGPSGVIGTNKGDASEVVRAMLVDAPTTPLAEIPAEDAIPALLAARGVRFISVDDWKKIEAVEIEKGVAQGRPRIKFSRTEEFFNALS